MSPEGDTAESDQLLTVSRYVLAATIGFSAFTALLEWHREGGASALSPLAQTLEAVGCIVALWKPRLGLAIVTVPLALTLIFGNMEADVLAPLVVLGAFAAMAPPLEAGIVALGFLGYAVARGLQSPPWWEMTAGYLLFLVPGAIAGIGLRALLLARRRGQGQVQVMEDDAAKIRGEERARLAAELRSLITVGLTRSRTVLDGLGEDPDPARLRTAIADVNDACLSALVEVRALVGMLREDPTGDGPDESIAGPWVSEVVRRYRAELGEARVPATFDVPGEFDTLGRVTQTTLVKAIEEVAKATLDEHRALRGYAIPGLIVLGERRRGRIILDAEYPAPLVPEPRQRRRLDRLRKRVEALGGTLRLSREGDTARLRLDLPLFHGASLDSESPSGRDVWRTWFTIGTLRGVLTMVVTLGALSAGAQIPGAVLAGQIPWPLLWEAAGFASAGLLMWWPRVGAVPAAIVLVGMLLTPHPDDVALVTLLLVACVQAARVASRGAAVWLGIAATAVMVAATFVDSGAVRERALAAIIVLLALPALIAVRHFMASRRRQMTEIAALEAVAEGIRVEERNLLARELHDVVAHHLSVAALQSMAYGDSDDPEELRTALDRMRRSTRGAEEEMDLLGRIMSGSAPPQPDSAIARPTVVGKALSQTLRDGGFPVRIEVDPASDALPIPTMRTLTRVMQEGVTNILRYGRRDGTCELTLGVDNDLAVLRISNAVPDRKQVSRLSLGYGLSGIRERVDLLGGSFAAGPQDGQWVVRVALPSGR